MKEKRGSRPLGVMISRESPSKSTRKATSWLEKYSIAKATRDIDESEGNQARRSQWHTDWRDTCR
jgi:hypothetical protein